jgi:hypothetical protein
MKQAWQAQLADRQAQEKGEEEQQLQIELVQQSVGYTLETTEHNMADVWNVGRTSRLDGDDWRLRLDDWPASIVHQSMVDEGLTGSCSVVINLANAVKIWRPAFLLHHQLYHVIMMKPVGLSLYRPLIGIYIGMIGILSDGTSQYAVIHELSRFRQHLWPGPARPL